MMSAGRTSEDEKFVDGNGNNSSGERLEMQKHSAENVAASTTCVNFYKIANADSADEVAEEDVPAVPKSPPDAVESVPANQQDRRKRSAKMAKKAKQHQCGRQPIEGQEAKNSHGWQGTKSRVKERMSHMCLNPYLADVYFIFPPHTIDLPHSQDSGTISRNVVEVRIPAHKFVLAIGSAVFDAMFKFDGENDIYSGHVHEITLVDVEPRAMKALLTFLYTDETSITADYVMSILYTAKKYAVSALEQLCVNFLKENLSTDNAFMLLAQARLYDEQKLRDLCLLMIDKETSDTLKGDGFLDINHETLCEVLRRDTLDVSELVLFKAVLKWADEHCRRRGLEPTPENQREVLGSAIRLLRFPQMTQQEFAEHVALSGLLTDRELVVMFLHFTLNPGNNNGTSTPTPHVQNSSNQPLVETRRAIQPKIPFSAKPRKLIGRELSVNRFQRTESSWGYSGTADRIKFTVDVSIYVLGFGLYGSIHDSSTYAVTIEIVNFGNSETLACRDTTFTCDGSPDTFKVMFKDPVEIEAGLTYIASARLRGPESYYGSKGLRRIVRQCPAYLRTSSPEGGAQVDQPSTSSTVTTINGDFSCITFQFSFAAGNNNGTSVDDGQLPELLFSEKTRSPKS